MNKWIPISEVREYIKGREMFVVKAFDWPVKHPMAYTTDPYCVWLEDTGKVCSRWPHPFAPTHFCLLPKDDEK